MIVCAVVASPQEVVTEGPEMMDRKDVHPQFHRDSRDILQEQK